MSVIVIENALVDYDVREGGDQSIIFLHGGFGSSSELWTRTMAALPARYTGYALNNFIRSDPPRTGYNVAAFAHRAGEFIKQLGLVRPVLVGHSMGGVVCQLAALEYPGLVGGLVLVCTGASMRNHELGRRLLAEMKTGGNAEETIRSVSSHWFHRPPPPPGFFDEYVARASSASWQAIIDVQESLIAADVEDRLQEIRVPTLVVYGGHDTGRTIDHAETLLHGIAGSRLAAMTDSGHSPMLETPDAFDAEFHHFLANDVWPERGRADPAGSIATASNQGCAPVLTKDRP
jgi:pimeloyl-ACP methyl ester carboxylesterase